MIFRNKFLKSNNFKQIFLKKIYNINNNIMFIQVLKT